MLKGQGLSGDARVRSWVMLYVYESPHKEKYNGVYVCEHVRACLCVYALHSLLIVSTSVCLFNPSSLRQLSSNPEFPELGKEG